MCRPHLILNQTTGGKYERVWDPTAYRRWSALSCRRHLDRLTPPSAQTSDKGLKRTLVATVRRTPATRSSSTSTILGTDFRSGWATVASYGDTWRRSASGRFPDGCHTLSQIGTPVLQGRHKPASHDDLVIPIVVSIIQETFRLVDELIAIIVSVKIQLFLNILTQIVVHI